jgi:hypothetical protein
MGGFIAKSKFANDLTVLISDKNWWR